jgi:hypothetical protein
MALPTNDTLELAVPFSLKNVVVQFSPSAVKVPNNFIHVLVIALYLLLPLT